MLAAVVVAILQVEQMLGRLQEADSQSKRLTLANIGS